MKKHVFPFGLCCVLGLLLKVVDLNTATLVELDALPGIGPVVAGRIIAFREKRGGFRRIEELLAIPGISERRWQELKELVEIDEPRPAGTRATGRL
jgi:competence ComEA-like helix-hairpin-helix protein